VDGRGLSGAGVALSALLCPCHVLSGAALAALAALGGPLLPLSPALQDTVHAVYLPSALLVAARLLTGRAAKGAPPP
jgi:hypothetical protein